MSLTKLHHNTLVRFLFVGGWLALTYAVLAALATTHLPLPKPLSAAGVWLICVPLGFWCQRRFTFKASTQHRHALLIYAAVQVIGIGIASLAAFLLARGEFWWDLAVHLGASALAAVVSYLVNRLIVFPAKKPETTD
ncbi:MAG: GtrA family protein [Tabrizicola sp.]|nr:GtrA family protein [Tabrizicola sp.]